MQHKEGSVQLLGFHAKGDGGGGVFYWDATEDRANHNGGTIIDPTNTADLATWDATAQTAWFTAGSGTGCWIREYDGAVDIKLFGAKCDLSSDDSTVIQHCFDTLQEQQIVISESVRSESNLILKGSYTKLVFRNNAYIDFHLTGNTDDCFLLQQTSYSGLEIENAYMDFNGTGLDGLVITRGKPTLSGRVKLTSSYRDTIAIKMSSASYDWVENLSCGDVELSSCGRHAIGITLTESGAFNGTPFLNESHIKTLEVRGIGRNFASANAICVTFDNTSSSSSQKVSGIQIGQCNLDAQVSSAVANVSHAIYGKSVNSGVGALESWFIKGGGWESTSGVAPVGLKNVEVDSGVSASSFTLVGVINYQWSYSVGDAFKNGLDNYYVENNSSFGRGAYLPKAKTKPNGNALEGEAGLINGFTNAPVGFMKVAYLVASGTVDIDVPYTPVSPYQETMPVEFTLFHQAYRGSTGTYAYGKYLLSINDTGSSDVVQKYLISSASANGSYTFDPSTVSFSIPTSGTLRITVTAGANVGSGGSSNRLFVQGGPASIPFNTTVTTLAIV